MVQQNSEDQPLKTRGSMTELLEYQLFVEVSVRLLLSI